jgi:hypothetical protein
MLVDDVITCDKVKIVRRHGFAIEVDDRENENKSNRRNSISMFIMPSAILNQDTLIGNVGAIDDLCV